MPQATTHRWSKFFLLATAMMMALAATQVKTADSVPTWTATSKASP